MDVTPSPKMLEVFKKMTDAIVGEEPLKSEQSPAANKRRQQRGMLMQVFHDISRLSMREGVGRHLNEMGKPTRRDDIIPSSINRRG